LTALIKPAKKAERLFTIVVIVIWAIAFGIYFVNKPDPSLLGLSTAYAYSLLWWVAAILAFIAYTVYDLSKGD
jgi:hypothetical protein